MDRSQSSGVFLFCIERGVFSQKIASKVLSPSDAISSTFCSYLEARNVGVEE